MGKVTYIPGEIANAAIDEHGNRKPVTRTQHIFDDVKDKSQAEVNAEVDNTFAFHQSEINALNSQNYVTVDSFSSLPATGAVDTVYRVSNWDGTQQDPTVYSEYAWNGEDYVHLSTKTQIGEVFDISEYNNATYNDLSDALSGTNVPVGIRKGGMSVKFVLNSDNKYVQYRLMKNTWSTTVTDWQGIDSVPNLSSENLVKSNGIEVDILSQMKKVGAVVLPLNSDKVYNVGEVGTTFDLNSYTIQATFKSCVFPCSYGDTLTVSGEGTLSASPLFAFVSANNVVLSRATKYVYNNENITVPENTAYVVLQSRDLTRGDIKLESNASVAKTIATINTSLASKATKTELNEEHDYVNNHLVVDFQSIKDSYSEDGGMRIDTSGIIGPNTSYDCAVYEFPKGKTYTVNISGGRGDINCRLYGITSTYPITGGDNSQGDSATVGKTSAENVTIDATAQKMYLYVNIPVGNNTSRVYFYATMQEVFTDFATKQELESEHDYVNGKLNISFIAIKNSFSTEGGMRLDGSGTLQKNSSYDCAVYEFPKGNVYTVNIYGGRGYAYDRLYGITTRKPEDIGTGAYNTVGSNDTKGKTSAENVVIDATDNTMYLYIDIPVGNNTSSVYYYASLSDVKHQVDELDVAVVNGDKLHDSYGFLNFVSDNPVKNLITSPSLVSMIDSWGVLGASYDSGEYEYLDDGVVKYEDRYEDSWPQKMGRINGISMFNFTAGGMSCKAWCQNNPYYPQNRVWAAAQQTENLKQAYVIHFGGLNDDISSVGDLATDVDLNDYNNNADTYAGWLAGVVQRLRSVNPNCFIFMSTMNRWNRLNDQDGQEYDDVVRAIPAFFNNYRIYLLDVRTYGPGTSYASVFNTGGHPNAFGHTYLAFMYNTYLDYVIKNNINDFKEVQFVLDGKHRI